MFLFVVAPIWAAAREEVLFRGYLQGALSDFIPQSAPLIVAVAAAFAHFFQGLMLVALLQMPIALLFAAAYRSTRSLLVVWIAHTLVAFILFAEYYLVYNLGVDRWRVCLGPALVASVGIVCRGKTAVRSIKETIWQSGWSRMQLVFGAASTPILLALITWMYPPNILLDWPALSVIALGGLTLSAVLKRSTRPV